jgi:hypothetical protein
MPEGTRDFTMSGEDVMFDDVYDVCEIIGK